MMIPPADAQKSVVEEEGIRLQKYVIMGFFKFHFSAAKMKTDGDDG